MYNTPLPTNQKIKKSQIIEAVLFAIDTMPEVDRATLETFLALVDSNITSEAISKVQLIGLMNLTLRYHPNAHPDSLLVLVALLEAQLCPGCQPADSPVIPDPSQLGLITQFQLV